MLGTEGSLAYYRQRLDELEQEANQKGGMLPRHEWWRVEYYRNPYLLLVSDAELHDRFVDIMANSSFINKEGKISPTREMFSGRAMLGSAFTHAIEAMNSRGGVSFNSAQAGQRTLSKYFENGTPIGVRMFQDKPTVQGNSIVKFSKARYARALLVFRV